MKTLALICLLMLLGATMLPARNVRVEAINTPAHSAARLEGRLEEAFQVVAERTGLVDDGPVHLVLVTGPRTFREFADADGVAMNPESVLGYAVPSRRRLVLNLSAIAERGFDPVGVLRHEVAHLVLDSSLRTARPLWFEEGVAQYVEAVPLNLLLEGAASTPLWVDYQGLADLSDALRQAGRSGQAYSDARGVIQLLEQRHGRARLKELMSRLARGGQTFEDAFGQAMGESLSAFEEAWLEELRRRRGTRLLVWLGANWWIVMFAAAGVILTLGIFLRRRRGASQLDTWDEQEKYYPSDPAWSYQDDKF
jgi:hypothetical protein